MAFPNGRFVWFEYMSKDVKKAQGFYGELFGWTSQTMPPDYQIITLGDERLGGFVPTPPGAPEHGHWLPHLQVEDAKATAAQIKSLGGKVRKEPVQMGEWGTWAVVADPTNATFILWQPAKPEPADYKGVPGAFCWVELATDDPEKAIAFYKEIGGFSEDKQMMGEMAYHILNAGGKGRAGVMKRTPPQPNAWLPYVQVASADLTADKAKRLGGNIIVPPADIPNTGRFAVIVDPQGGGIGILQPVAK